jgi:hypothetical protein
MATSAVTATAAVSYGILYAFSAEFTRNLGTTPEELGLGQSTFVVRAAIYGILLVGLCLAAMMFLAGIGSASLLFFAWFVGKFSGGRRAVKWLAAIGAAVRRHAPLVLGTGTHVWSASRTGRLRRETLVVACICAIPPAALAALSTSGDSNGFKDSILWALPVMVISLSAIVRRRYVAGVLIAALSIAAAAVLGAQSAGKEVADQIRSDGSTDFPLALFGIMADPTRVQWPARVASPVPSQQLILLGHSDGILIFTDRRHVIRLSSYGLMVTADLPAQ